MFLLTRPSDQRIVEFLTQQHGTRFSYEEVGTSATGTCPRAMVIDHNRKLLGYGEQTYGNSVAAVTQWKMFDFPWLKLCWPDVPIKVGTEVAILIRHMGVWSLNASRIIYIINEKRRFGFAYGTLREHAESGEERFIVDWNPEDDSVHYDLWACSRPQALLARLARPFARRLQRRFARDSMAAMLRATT
jgi:uncharacterized protein (UPF0548 family)